MIISRQKDKDKVDNTNWFHYCRRLRRVGNYEID